MEKEQLFLCTTGKGYHFHFTCEVCKKEYELVTGQGRYGNLGPFDCPYCNEKYYATIDDHQDPSLYLAKLGQQPTSLFDSEGRKKSVKIKNDGHDMY